MVATDIGTGGVFNFAGILLSLDFKFKSMTVFTLVFLMRLFTAFAPEQEVKGTLNATVDGRPFALAEGQMMRGVLVNKEGSMDGRTPARTVISVNFTGATYKKLTRKILRRCWKRKSGLIKT